MDITTQIAEIDRLIVAGQYQVAANQLAALEGMLESSVQIAFNYAGFAIDIGSRWPNQNLLEKGLEITRSIKDQLQKTDELYGSCCYNIANALDTKIKWKQLSSDHHYWVGDSEVEDAKANYREALSIFGDNVSIKPMVWVNYGNLLNGRLGRCLEAFECYDRALSLKPDFGMALANRGYAQSLFAYVVGGDAGTVLLHEAYTLLKHGLAQGLDAGPQCYFESVLNGIKKLFPKPQTLETAIECSDTLEPSGRSFRDFYRRFCHQERLCLNPLGRNHRCEAALYDPLILKGMITDVDDDEKFYCFSTYLNQIKQEFVTARFLAAQSYFKDLSFKFMDEGVTLINTLDYPAYSLFLELAKTAFRLTYSILDKVAFVANEYLDLGFNPQRLYFHNLAPLKNEEVLRRLKPIQNPYVGALLDLANDFVNGYFEELRQMRHAFEHRSLTVHLDFAIPRSSLEHSPSEKPPSKEESKLLKASEFRARMLDMMRLAKAAIFYLVLLIDWAERQKRAAMDTRKVVPMFVDMIPDHLKGEL